MKAVDVRGETKPKSKDMEKIVELCERSFYNKLKYYLYTIWRLRFLLRGGMRGLTKKVAIFPPGTIIFGRDNNIC
jgi:hypothetical protein